MERNLLFDCQPGWTRAAVVEDGRLCELHLEQAMRENLTESLFYGRVMRIRPSVCAAFVDIGLPLNAFLPLDEAGAQPLRCGDMLIVQGAARQANDTKGLRVTTRINLAGQTLVLVPGKPGIHVSKKIKNEADRQVLAEAAQSVCPPDCGLIVRTASQDVTLERLEQEAQALYGNWQDIRRRASGMTRPGLLWSSLPLEERLIRDWAGKPIDRILTTGASHARRLKEQQAQGLLDGSIRIEWFEERETLLFDAFSIEEAIDKALRRRVWLPGGGYLVIDICEAMTVIDVNSGKMTLGRDIEETALRVNLEAAQEVARQIRLRNLGGMIVVDLIDMKPEKNREAVLQAFRQAVLCDSMPVKVLGLTRLGLLEMTRKRKGDSLHRQLCTSCTSCSGAGEMLSAEAAACSALRQVRRMALSGQSGPFLVRCAPQTAAALAACANPLEADVYALGAGGRRPDRWDIEQLGAGAVPDGAKPLPHAETE